MARTDSTLSEGVEAVEESLQLFDYPTLPFNSTSSNTSTGRGNFLDTTVMEFSP